MGLSTSVGGTGSFSAPTVTHSTSGNAHETQSFLLLYGKKILPEHLPQPICLVDRFVKKIYTM